MAIDECMEGYARDCIRLAGMTSDAEIRAALLKMAGQWTEAASSSKQRQAARQVPQPIHVTSAPNRS